MAPRKNATAKRGRPPKNAVAKKRSPGRPRKVRDTTESTMPSPIEMLMAGAYNRTSAAEDAQSQRMSSLSIALECRKLTQGVSVSVDSLIEDAEKIRKYLSVGIPEAAPAPAADPNVGPIGSGGMTLAARGDEFDPSVQAPGEPPLAAATE